MDGEEVVSRKGKSFDGMNRIYWIGIGIYQFTFDPDMSINTS